MAAALLARAVADAECAALCREALGENWQALLARYWQFSARPEQLPPPGAWRIWLMMAGRGFGKTRAGAEWVQQMALAHKGLRIALVGATMDDVRHVMVEGESGILNLYGSSSRPRFNPSLRRLTWANDSIATCYSAAEPESLRGPQHHYAWADEIARWQHSGRMQRSGGMPGGAVAAWDNLMLGLRLGVAPQILATTTPRAVPLVEKILKLPGLVVTGGATQDNAAHLPDAFLDAMEANYGGTLLGRQELGGELILETPGALWSRSLLEACRSDAAQLVTSAMQRVVIGVDPPASVDGDACGIVVAAEMAGYDPAGFAVLEDASVEGETPAGWARAVAKAAVRWDADLVVAEANNGGNMVQSVLQMADAGLPVRLVHAKAHKGARAEPVSLLYEQGRVRHFGHFATLEDQLCGLMPGGGYAGPGRSPDRADALVWALTTLKSKPMLPGIRQL